MVNKENKYIPGVYKNPSNYETIKVYIVVPGDPYDASILGVFRDKRKAELYAEIHNCVVEEFETSDDEEIVFGWKVSVIYTNRTGKMSIDVSKYEIGPFSHDDITKVKPYSACPYCHTDIVLFMTRYIRDEYATEDRIRTTYKKAARDIMAYCEERISSGYKTSQINEFLKSKVERGYFK